MGAALTLRRTRLPLVGALVVGMVVTVEAAVVKVAGVVAAVVV